MATWQFDMHLLPAASVERGFGGMPESIGAEDFDREAWWADFDRDEALDDALAAHMTRGRSWMAGMDVWGDEGGDRVDVSRKDGRIVEIFVRIDVRELSRAHLTFLVDVANRFELLFVTEERRLLQPSVEDLLAAIRRSRAAEFVLDPSAFFARLRREHAAHESSSE